MKTKRILGLLLCAALVFTVLPATALAAGAADLTVTAATVSHPEPLVGETVTFTIILTNNGPDDATGVTVSAPLPAGLTFVSATPSQGTYNDTTGIWTVGSVASGAAATLQLTATVAVPGPLVLPAAVASSGQFDPDPVGDWDTASINATPNTDLAVTQTMSGAPLYVGDTATLVITVKNNGPYSAMMATVFDILPAGLTFVSAAQSRGAYDSGTGIWTLVGPMPPDWTETLALNARVTAAGTMTNTASVQSLLTVDQFAGNDTYSKTFTAYLSDPGAGTFYVSDGDIVINDAGGGELTVTYGTGTTTAPFPSTQEIIIGGATSVNTVTVSPNVTANITLSGVSIDVSAAGLCAFNMDGADVSLTLEGTNALQSGDSYAGIRCPEYAALGIGGTGKLTAAGGENGAGIGGNNGEKGGDIEINGGTVTATGGSGGAGIGGGKNGRGGSVIIDGGDVTAEGGNGADIGGAGLGGGALGSGGTIEINGGTVEATGQHGAGIGGGDNKPGGDITISGGTVTTGSESGAGIGGGINGNGGNIAVTGGTVIAASSTGAGIGGGDGGDSGAIAISGGVITAESTGGAGVGGGRDGGGETIEISGGSLTAQGGLGAAGIGVGNSSAGGAVSITGGTVAAQGGEYGPGIGSGSPGMGGGDGGNGGTISVSGGTVTARGGSNAAGIGGGWLRSGGAVSISGGSVLAAKGGGGAEDIGHGVELSPGVLISGTLTNGQTPDENVYLTKVTLSGAGAVPVDSLGIAHNGAAYAYGINDMSSNVNGMLYLYLPAGASTTAAQAAGTYTGEIVTLGDHSAEGTLYADRSYTITASAGAGGSISPSGTVPAAEGSSRTFTITPDTGYGIDFVLVDGVDQGAISSYTFTNVNAGHTISAAFRYMGSGGSGYIRRTLTDSASGVAVSGAIHRRAALTVKAMALHTEGACAACDAIRKAQKDNQLIFGFDISLTRGFSGPLTVTIPVDERYDGRTVTILHCVNGRLETLTATVTNGKAAFTVTELSPFAVTTGLLVPDTVVTGPPKTGDGPNRVWRLLCGVSMAGTAALTLWKRRGPQKR
ncbi:MAG TPA: DUF11 domain-containing protein [Feifaniaceae bacterium]|nr:DUF11 domain-containing protein [Feifaniaceae bacterium]